MNNSSSCITDLFVFCLFCFCPSVNILEMSHRYTYSSSQSNRQAVGDRSYVGHSSDCFLQILGACFDNVNSIQFNFIIINNYSYFTCSVHPQIVKTSPGGWSTDVVFCDNLQKKI